MHIKHQVAVIVTILLAAAPMIARHVLGASDAAEPQGPRPGAPYFEIDKSWPRLPAQWKLGHISSIAIDDKDNVWVLHRPRTLPEAELSTAAPPIVIFDADGKFVRGWGGPGAGYEWPEREHGIHIDYKGYVWIGGNHCADVADGYGNRRVAVFDADTGAYKRMWGAFANKPVDNAPCPPVNAAFVPGDPGPDQFSTVHAIRVSRDGNVYVADRELRRVQVFTPDGKFVRQRARISSPFARSLAFSPDAEQRFLYVGGGIDITVLDRKTLELVDLIGGQGLAGGGHHITTDSRGNIYVAHVAGGMQKLTFKGIAPAR